MMTMISAFIVKRTPIDASKVRKVDRITPPAAVTAPPSAKAQRAQRGTSMATSDGRPRIDRHRAQRDADAGAVQAGVERAADQQRRPAKATTRLRPNGLPKISNGTARNE